MSKGSIDVGKSIKEGMKEMAKEVADIVESEGEIKLKADGTQAKNEAKETADVVRDEIKNAQKDSNINITADGSQAIEQTKRSIKAIKSEISKLNSALKELKYEKEDLLGSSKTNRKDNITSSYKIYTENNSEKHKNAFLKDAYAIELAGEKLTQRQQIDFDYLKKNDAAAQAYLSILKNQTHEYEKQGQELQNTLAKLQQEVQLRTNPAYVEPVSSEKHIETENSALITQQQYVKELSDKEKELWDARFKNSIKELTYRDPVFDKMKTYYQEEEKELKRLDTLKNKYGKYAGDVSNINQARSSFNALLSQYKSAGPIIEKNLNNGMKQFTSTVIDAEGHSQKLVATIADGKMYTAIRSSTEATSVLSKFTKELGNRWKAVAAYFLSFSSFFEIIEVLKKGFTIVNELDDSLTEMRKVSEEPLAILKEYQAESFKTANAVGTTAKALQDSTASWMRLGESLEDAKESAKDATILMNVSEFDNIDDATKSLVAMSQAYNEFSKIEIIDKLNNIGNNYSIATNDLASSLQRSAATLKIAGNTLDEAIALTTAGNSILQDPDSVGAGLKTISLRILGTKEAKEELASLGEDVDDFIVQTSSKLDEQVRHFTAVASNAFKGVSLLDDNGNYRSTYKILADISEIYSEILETDKKFGTNRGQGLVELMAGKNRANILSSILQAPDLLKNVYESAQNSAGSAEEELEKYLDSLSGRIDKLKNQLEELASVSFDTDFLKGAISAATELLSLITKIVDTIGIVPTLGIAGGSILGISKFVKNFDQTHHESLKIA